MSWDQVGKRKKRRQWKYMVILYDMIYVYCMYINVNNILYFFSCGHVSSLQIEVWFYFFNWQSILRREKLCGDHCWPEPASSLEPYEVQQHPIATISTISHLAHGVCSGVSPTKLVRRYDMQNLPNLACRNCTPVGPMAISNVDINVPWMFFGSDILQWMGIW